MERAAAMSRAMDAAVAMTVSSHVESDPKDMTVPGLNASCKPSQSPKSGIAVILAELS